MGEKLGHFLDQINVSNVGIFMKERQQNLSVFDLVL